MKFISKIFFLVSSLLIMFSAFAQNDSKATEILKGVSAKTKSYQSIKITFEFKLDNATEKIHETKQGSLLLKGEMFTLSIAGQEIYSNGKTVWTYIKDANEVQINDSDDSNTDELNPKNLFSIYEKGFKKKFVGEKGNNQTIDLFPVATNKSYSKIRIVIDKTKQNINSCIVYDKNGSIYTYSVKTFIPNIATQPNTFSFEKKNYPGVEIVDLR